MTWINDEKMTPPLPHPSGSEPCVERRSLFAILRNMCKVCKTKKIGITIWNRFQPNYHVVRDGERACTGEEIG